LSTGRHIDSQNYRRDELYTKKQKRLAKIKIDFVDLFGVGGTRVLLIVSFSFYKTAVPSFFFFENVLYSIPLDRRVADRPRDCSADRRRARDTVATVLGRVVARAHRDGGHRAVCLHRLLGNQLRLNNAQTCRAQHSVLYNLLNRLKYKTDEGAMR
jgi:hypothetical protein